MVNSRTYNEKIIGFPGWSNSRGVCAFSDDERHLGHILKIRGWHAFDATKSNSTGDGYLHLGVFPGQQEAKDAVERSITRSARRLAMAASCLPAPEQSSALIF